MTEPCEPRVFLSVAASTGAGNEPASYPPVILSVHPDGRGAYNPRDIIPPGPSPEFTSFIGRNFEGVNRNTSGFIPPDTHGAAGPNHLIEIVNGRYRVYSKDGVIQRDLSLDGFWAVSGVSLTGFSFDPRILYDDEAGRWYAVSVDNAGNDNNFLVAVSRTTNPLDGFVGFKIDSDAQTGQRWADYPVFGYDSEGVYVTGNMFGISGGGTEINLLVLPKVDLLLATPNVSRRTLIEDIGAIVGFTAQPVTYLEPHAYPPKLVSAGSSSINFSRLGGTIFAPTVLADLDVAVSPRSGPPLARQPDGTSNLNAGDNRQSSSVFFRNGSYYSVQGVAAPRGAARFTQVSSALTLQREQIISDPVLDFLYPSVGVNGNGDVAVGFTASGPNAGQFASSYAVVGNNSGGTLSFTTPFITRAGTSSYAAFDNSGRNRWGDYSATVFDPANPTRFWTFQEFAIGPGTWSTQLTELLVQPVAAPPGTPDLSAGSDAGISTSDDVTNDSTPTFNGTAPADSTVRLYADANLVGTVIAGGDGAWSITSVPLIDGLFEFSATADIGTGESVRSDAVGVTIDTVAPALLLGEFRFQTSQALRYVFHEFVAAAGNVQLFSLPALAPVAATFTAVASATAVTFTANPVLADGNYRGALSGPAVTDIAGNPSAGANVDFFVLAGDANRDRIVNVGDFGILASSFNLSPRNFGAGDFNYNGTVEIGDFSILASRFNFSLAAPGGVPLAPAASAFVAPPGSRAMTLAGMFSEQEIDALF